MCTVCVLCSENKDVDQLCSYLCGGSNQSLLDVMITVDPEIFART